MRYCPECGTKIEKEDAAYCTICGTSLSSAIQTSPKHEVRCRRCDTRLEPDAKHCFNCGNKVTSSTSRTIMSKEDSDHGDSNNESPPGITFTGPQSSTKRY